MGLIVFSIALPHSFYIHPWHLTESTRALIPLSTARQSELSRKVSGLSMDKKHLTNADFKMISFC